MIFRIVTAVLTILFTLGLLALSIFALTIPSLPTAGISLLIAAGFGLFVWHDYQFFFGKKNNVTNNKV
jgi:protein-S-isoprenylcysteine O-methyltransferase Ste14